MSPEQAVTTGNVCLETVGLSGMGDFPADVSFSLRRGEVLGIAGLVGSGRTSLAVLLAGAARPNSGYIKVHGKQVAFKSPLEALRHGIVLLPEDRHARGLIPIFSVRENISIGALRRFRALSRIPWISKSAERHAVGTLVKQLGIKGELDSNVLTLSGGNQQKVVIARLLLTGADILIMDEPTAGVDVQARQEIFALIRNIAADGAAIIMISSDFSDLEAACDRVLVMRDGQFLDEITGSDLNESGILRVCYSGGH